jgi:GNAT superfamily N-acetyltransferase
MREEEASKVGKELLKSAVDLAKKLNFKIIYLSLECSELSLVSVLSSLGFNFICAALVRAIRKKDLLHLRIKEKPSGKYEFRRSTQNDYRQIIDIAKEIGKDVRSKFSLTPGLGQELKDKYYVENIKNCCLGLNADEVFVAVKNKAVVGFVCYRHDKVFEEILGKRMSYLVMLGVLQSERRNNLGTYLVDWTHKQVFKNSEILLGRTYLHNLPMIRFILRRGATSSLGFTYTFCKEL